MKTFQKITLAAAISAAPFMAQADLTPMDDSLMGNTTGQAGVTIEIDIDSAGISVGEIEYIDEGSVILQDITVKNVSNLTQKIDVDAEGNLLIGMSGVTGMQVGLGDTTADTTGASSALALKGSAGTTEVINNLDMTLNLGETTTQIINLAGAAGSNSLEAAALTAGFGAEAFEGSVAIRATTSLQITDLNAGMFGYTRDQATSKVANSLAAANTGTTAADYIDLATGELTAAAQAAPTGASTTAADSVNELANGAAINVGGVQFYDLEADGVTKKAATIDQVIWAKGGTEAQGAGLYIQIGEIAGTLEVGSVQFGSTPSIGTIKVSDINLAGLTQRIYGH